MAGLLRVFATGVNSLAVDLDAAAATSGAGAGSRADNWLLTDGDGASLSIASATQQSTAQSWKLTFYPRLRAGVTYTLSARTSLQTAGGASYTSPGLLTFTGMVQATTPKAATKRAAGLDFAHVVMGDARTGERSGTYLTAAGDYALASGAAAWQQDYLRRLLTDRGGFLHAPEYGCALRPKTPMRGGSAVALAREVEQQLLREPRTVRVAPRITTEPERGLVIVAVQVERDDGAVVDATAKVV